VSETDFASQRATARLLAPILAERGVHTAVILGSGLARVAADVNEPLELDYAELAGFPRPTVPGHPGRLVVGTLGGAPVALLVGRGHLYEGLSAGEVAAPVRIMRAAGVDTLVVTNACGSVAEGLSVGDLVSIRDHIDLTGESPLRGPESSWLGARFPAMAGAWDAGLRVFAHEAAERAGVGLGDGVYAGVPGPAYETPAEVEMLRRMGADVVGMSTVTEAVAARAAGMRLAGLSLVTNAAGSLSVEGHGAVLAASDLGADRLLAVLRGLLRRLGGGA
jgi:inosine/guanosine/xanthosine phosphorylase family protein